MKLSCYYSWPELLVLVSVVVLGAGRTILTKLYFQLGHDDPFFVTILVLLGHSFGLPVYLLGRKWIDKKKEGASPQDESDTYDEEDEEEETNEKNQEHKSDDAASTTQRTPLQRDLSKGSSVSFVEPEQSVTSRADDDIDNDDLEEPSNCKTNQAPSKRHLDRGHGMRKSGSRTGLTDDNSATDWVHRIPFLAKPLVTSIFGLLDAVFRVSSVLFLPASIADMLNTGLELFFIIVAQKIIRKRKILTQRWVGAGIVIAGLILVTCSDFTAETSMETKSLGLGMLCVLGKVVAGVSLDMAQELFTQEAEMPALLLLGMESMYGLVIFVPIYIAIGPLMDCRPLEAVQNAIDSSFDAWFTLLLLAMFAIAGIFQILGTSVVSSMTRNLWITSFRGTVVWMIALAVYYITGNADLGEQWYNPGSYMIMTGVVIIFTGVRVYYWQRPFPQVSMSQQDRDHINGHTNGHPSALSTVTTACPSASMAFPAIEKGKPMTMRDSLDLTATDNGSDDCV